MAFPRANPLNLSKPHQSRRQHAPQWDLDVTIRKDATLPPSLGYDDATSVAFMNQPPSHLKSLPPSWLHHITQESRARESGADFGPQQEMYS